LSNRGAALQLLNRNEEALQSYDQALALEPYNSILHFNRGRALQDLGRAAEALESYDLALAGNPNFAAALNNRGNTLRSLRRYPEALESYNRALAIEPGNVETLYNRGNMQWQVGGNYAAAVRDMEKAVTINPGYDYALGELFYLRLHGADWRESGS